MFKWGIFRKELEETHLPRELQEMVAAVYADHASTDREVQAIQQLSDIVRHQHEELEALRRRAQDMEFQVDQVNRETSFQADLLTSLCDEIQAPIHTLNQLGDWLDQTHLDASQRAGFIFYRRTARKLQGMFKDIIDIARMREGVLLLDPITFQVHEEIRGIMQTLNLTAQEKGIPFKVNIDPDVPDILVGDIKRLEQILMSLGHNAIKFTYEGEVAVRIQKVSEEGGECVLKFIVQDSGMGIPSNQIHTIFDRLAQGDPDVERNYGGTGLGLYICKSLVEQMGGNIWAENREAGGASFGFCVPFENGSAEEISVRATALASEEKPRDESGPLDLSVATEAPQEDSIKKTRVLLVEDDLATCRLIEGFLDQNHYDIEVVHDGVSAIDKYDEDKYDLILMDIQLPHLDGVGATMEIRNKENHRQESKTPIVALVGDPGADEGSHYLAGDFDKCLFKPVSRDTLLDTISHLKSPKD